MVIDPVRITSCPAPCVPGSALFHSTGGKHIDYIKQLRAFWQAIDAQNWEKLPAFFAPEAEVYWPNTNERFTVQDFTRANSEYPGDWRITLVKQGGSGEEHHTVVRVDNGEISFHAISFFTFGDGGVKKLVEYWSENGPPPAWRTEKGIGKPIQTP